MIDKITVVLGIKRKCALLYAAVICLKNAIYSRGSGVDYASLLFPAIMMLPALSFNLPYCKLCPLLLKGLSIRQLKYLLTHIIDKSS